MVEFQKINASDVALVRRQKSSRYDSLVEACSKLNPTEMIAVRSDGEDKEKFRLNVSNTIRRRINDVWQAAGIMKSLRVSAGKDPSDQDVVVIECKEVTQEQLKKRKEARENRSLLMKKRIAEKKKAGIPLRKPKANKKSPVTK